MLFLTSIAYTQNTTISFLYGTEKTLAGEILFKTSDNFYLGGGYGGVLNADKNNLKEQKWCDAYVVSSFGYLGSVMVKYKTGVSFYTEKKDVNYKPLIGIGAMYQVCNNYGLEVGIDNFNKVTFGFCAIF